MEDKTLNFTTQNSFLHYGVKGMKWGVITSLYEKVGRQAHGRAETRRRNSAGYTQQKPIVTGSYDTKYPNGGHGRQKNVTGLGGIKSSVTYGKARSPIDKYDGSVSGGPVSGRPGGYGNSRAVEQGKKDAEKEKKATMRITDEEMAKNAIETSNAHAQGKMIGDDKEKETITAFDNIENDEDIITISNYMKKRSPSVNEINKYTDAMDSIADMDPKYTKQFFDKYGSKITDAVLDYTSDTAVVYNLISAYAENNKGSLSDSLYKEVQARSNELSNDMYSEIENEHDLVSAKEGMAYDEELLEKIAKELK